MQAIWFSSKDDRKRVKRDFEVAEQAFKRLAELLRKKMKKSSGADYEMPAWPYYQADTNGYNRALTEVLNLIEEGA